MLVRKQQKGDTIVEVLLAIAVFGAVSIGSIVIMNQGLATAQASLEQNLVRNQIDTQAELLRYYHSTAMASADGDPATAAWRQIMGTATASASDYDAIDTVNDCVPYDSPGVGIPTNSFYIDPSTGKVVTDKGKFRQPQTFAQVREGDLGHSDMIWIEAVHNAESPSTALSSTKFYDFHIRACWEAPGTNGLMKLGTIVRLYAPNK